jgi:hypothetical protein
MTYSSNRIPSGTKGRLGIVDEVARFGDYARVAGRAYSFVFLLEKEVYL